MQFLRDCWNSFWAEMNKWRVKPDRIGRGWFISKQATYYLYRDGSVELFASDNVSCFWGTAQEAGRFLITWFEKRQ